MTNHAEQPKAEQPVNPVDQQPNSIHALPPDEVTDGQTLKAQGEWREVGSLALKIGITAFGGPAAHISMLRQEVVIKRTWMTEQRFLDLIGVTSLIPGPSSTEMVMEVGRAQAGWKGLLAAGTAFILPAAMLSAAAAWLYMRYGTSPGGIWILYAVQPIVVALLLQAIWGLGRSASRKPFDLAIAAFAAVAFTVGVNELLILFGGAICAFLVRKGITALGTNNLLSIAALLPFLAVSVRESTAIPATEVTLVRLFLSFFKIGALLWGSGYVLAAFLQTEFVDTLGWLSEDQLLDAIAVGQITPGPVFSSATFIGYILEGPAGAAVATIGIFLPAFILVAFIGRILTIVQARPNLRILMNQVNLISLGLMAGVAVILGRNAMVDWQAGVIFLAGAIALIKFNMSSTLLLPAAALTGLLIGQIR